MSKPKTTTPNHVRQDYDAAIDRLNSRWNLLIPKLHGRAAESAQQEKPLARRCAGRIRFLCFRSDAVLDAVMDEFEDYARQLQSNWVWKPAQETGTLPSLPVTKSFLHRDAISKSSGITPEQRQELLAKLDELLDDECQLSLASDSYQRTTERSSRVNEESPAELASHHEQRQVQSLEKVVERRKVVRDDASPGSKRKSSSDGTEKLELPKKRQSMISSFLYFPEGRVKVEPAAKIQDTLPKASPSRTKPKVDSRSVDTEMPPPLVPAVSCDSAASLERSSIFSRSTDTTTTSAQTSFASNFESHSQEYPCSTQETKDMIQSFTEENEPLPADASPVPNIDPALVHELVSAGPFRSTETLPPRVAFRNRYELCRLATALNVDPNELMKRTVSDGSDYQKFWNEMRRFRDGLEADLPEKSNMHAWNSATTDYTDKHGLSSVTLSGSLKWNERGQPGLLNLRLNALRLERSCRLHRRFGADRFIIIILPSLSPRNLPSHLSSHQRMNMHESVSNWLGTRAHHLLGRSWRAFFVEPHENKVKDSATPPAFKVHLFAVDGVDFLSRATPTLAPRIQLCETHTPMSIEQLLNWHIPIPYNSSSTDCKAFQRFSLGLSKTCATVTLETSEFLYLRDAPDKTVMNDGCARMSHSLGKDIAAKLGLNYSPSVFQGRVAGAKGLWMVEKHDNLEGTDELPGSKRGYWIEVSDSQLKIKPHPRDSASTDEEQRTFEVLAYSRPARAAYLNVQLMTILHDRGVPKELLESFLCADTRSYYTTLTEAMNSRLHLRNWMQSMRKVPREAKGIKMTGARPDSQDEQVILLLESGFEPETCPNMVECLRLYLREHMKTYVEKLKIQVPLSTFVYCIADPYGVLEPNEVHLGFSEVWRDPTAEFDDNVVHNLDVLVARLPAHLPSDVQRRKAVWKPELRHFKDVVVFSTKGDIPLADLLSGGDYDGDIPWVCWDQSLVDTFQNENPPSSPPCEAECGLVAMSRKLRDIFHLPFPSTTESNNFFTYCFSFNLQPSYLGTCSVEHEKLTYYTGTLSSREAITLAKLAGYLVDSAKQGHLLSEQSWRQLRRSVSGRTRLPWPAYKPLPSGRDEKMSKINTQHIIDYLKFSVAQKEMDRVLQDFNRSWPQQVYFDSDLSEPWKKAWNRAHHAKKELDQPELHRILEKLRQDVDSAYDEWLRRTQIKKEATDSSFARSVEIICDRVRSIVPLDMKHDFSELFREEAGRKYSYWNLLRASCLYKFHAKTPMPWYMVGEELCRIKAEARGENRLVLNDIHFAYRVDSKLVKQIQSGAQDDESMWGWQDSDSQLMVDLMQDS